jgi:hypothetical protein
MDLLNLLLQESGRGLAEEAKAAFSSLKSEENRTTGFNKSSATADDSKSEEYPREEIKVDHSEMESAIDSQKEDASDLNNVDLNKFDDVSTLNLCFGFDVVFD